MSNLQSVCCGADKYEDLEMCSMCMEWADFEEEDIEGVREYALKLLSTSSLRDDDDGLEDEIRETTPTEERWDEIFLRLRSHQLRPIDLPNFNQTEFSQSYKESGL